jgi:hypothetical protein
MICKGATKAAHPLLICKVLANIKKNEAAIAVSQLLEEWAQVADSFQVNLW